MAAPRRSKRIQALNQSNEGSRRVTKSPEPSKKDHPKKKRKMTGSQGEMPEGHSKGKASKGQVPKEQAPVIDPAVSWVCNHLHWYQQSVSRLTYIKAEQQKQQADERERKIDRSKEYLHSALALERKNDYVEEFWKDLRGSIESLVNVPSLWDVPWDSLDEALQQKFMSYAPNAEDLFGVPQMTWHIFQRWVWEIIDENFFSKKSKDIVWASPYWEAQAAMERYLQGTKHEMTEIHKLLERHSTNQTNRTQLLL
jgi:hypothetical protein